MSMSGESNLKLKTARTLKWNTIDRLSSQVLYAVVGVVLANLLSKEDFGLVGALLVFQAFGILFVDSGFGSALLQRKVPSRADYSTVFWFNLGVSVLVYGILFAGAPLIADIFQGDRRLIPMSRVMFLTFVLNGTALVQTTRLMKEMNVKMVAMANVIALTVSGAVGVILAFRGAGAWALVWQSVTLSGVKSAWLWATGGWRPQLIFRLESLKAMWRVGFSVFSSSALNTFFLYIYSFVIGAFYNLSSLGVYTQADKWSKMGSASISQILTATFVPLLSRVQDDRDSFNRYVTGINRFGAFILFPVLLGGAAVGAPLFHLLFGQKWDAAIPLFQILMVRGAFVVLISIYNNYLLALGYARKIFAVEIVKDLMIVAAVLATISRHTVEALVWGQLAASSATWIVVLVMVCRSTGYSFAKMLGDLVPFAIGAALCAFAALLCGLTGMAPVFQLITGIAAGAAVYILFMKLLRSPELGEAASYLGGKLRKER